VIFKKGKKMRIKNVITISIICASCIILEACAPDEPPQPQILSSSLKSISKNTYEITISSDDKATAIKETENQATYVQKEKNCQSYNVLTTDISVESKVLNPALAEALAEQAPKFGIGYLAQEKRNLAIEASIPVSVYTCSSKVQLVGCGVK
jgi:hypothetical protein